jgi:hypothetical protein
VTLGNNKLECLTEKKTFLAEPIFFELDICLSQLLHREGADLAEHVFTVENDLAYVGRRGNKVLWDGSLDEDLDKDLRIHWLN